MKLTIPERLHYNKVNLREGVFSGEIDRTNTLFVNSNLQKNEKTRKKDVFCIGKLMRIAYNATDGCKKCIVKLLVTIKTACYNR